MYLQKHTSRMSISKFCWVWGVHCRRTANISATVVDGLSKRSWHVGQLGSKNERSARRHGSQSSGSTAACSIGFRRTTGLRRQKFYLYYCFRMDAINAYMLITETVLFNPAVWTRHCKTLNKRAIADRVVWGGHTKTTNMHASLQWLIQCN